MRLLQKTLDTPGIRHDVVDDIVLNNSGEETADYFVLNSLPQDIRLQTIVGTT